METENVKERLSSLLQKKMIEQERECKNPSPSEQTVAVKQEIDRDRISNGESAENSVENVEYDPKEPFTESVLLHDILNEKKKALLQDKDVINFFQNKLKSN